jgi:integrase
LDSLREDRRKDGYVFPFVRKGRKEPAWVYDALNKVREKSGISEFTFHGLRHTAATIMVSETLGRGVGLADIMGVLGDRKVETTMKYLHGDVGRMRKAVEALEKQGKK